MELSFLAIFLILGSSIVHAYFGLRGSLPFEKLDVDGADMIDVGVIVVLC